MADSEVDQIVLARVTVTRVLDGPDVVDQVIAESADGTNLGLAEALGMMRLAEHTLIESYEAGE